MQTNEARPERSSGLAFLMLGQENSDVPGSAMSLIADIGFQDDWQSRVGQAMIRVIAVAGRTAKIVRIIANPGVHVDVAIPVIAESICGLVEQCVVEGRFKTATCCRLAHAVTHKALYVGLDIRNVTVIDPGAGGNVGRAVRWIAVTGGAVECERYGRSMA